ncbi:tyrosine-type recombinase/integrase [Citricoccus zhacaiensis]
METFTQPQIFDQEYFNAPVNAPKPIEPTAVIDSTATPVLASTPTPATVERANAPSRELTPVEQGRLLNLLKNSRSENTNAAYGRAWAAFVGWAGEQGHQAFPASPEAVALWLDALNEDGKRISTLTQGLSAINAVHSDAGRPFNFFHDRLIAASLRSAKRSMARDGRSLVSKPRAFRQGEMQAMVDSMPSTPQGARDKAILVLGANAGLRASEFAALDVSDLTFDEQGMDVLIRASKTDQEGEGERVYISRLAPAHRAFDAVASMEDWIAQRGNEEGALFIAYRKGGRTPHLIDGKVHGIGRAAVSDVLVRSFKRAGLTGRLPSSHSLRHSFITQAFLRHLDAAKISRVSRHKNLRSLMSYDQTSRKTNATAFTGLWS